MEQQWWKRSSQAGEWHEKDAVVVYRDAQGEIRYPGRNDQPTPAGCERVVLRSLQQVRAFERQHGVRNEAMDYDRGSGRGHDDHIQERHSPRRDTFSEVF